MTKANIIFLDAQTKDEEQRITSFGDSVTELLKDYMSWIKENDLIQKDMWYADIFLKTDAKVPKHFASIDIQDNGEFLITPAPENSKINPYKRRKSILEKLHWRGSSAC